VVLTDKSVSLRSAVLGYCAAHKDLVAAKYADQLASEGDVEWLADPPAELRPGDVAGFLASVDRMLTDGIAENMDVPGGKALTPVTDHVPENCPHCGAELSWGTGPHVSDAARRPRAIAWQCTECGAAGMLTST
jgi:predicted RNA-binding Zn-ribbon protein involved in translation (DUF1610 family)